MERKTFNPDLKGRVSKVVACGGMVLSLSGCLSLATNYQGGDGLKVAVAGDSQIYQAENDPSNSLTTAISALKDPVTAENYQVSKSTLIGANTSDLLANPNTAFTGWPSVPDIAVEDLGTNDLHVGPNTNQSYITLADAEKNLSQYLVNTGAQCNVLIEVVETTPWGLDKTAPAWNAYLAQKVIDDPSHNVLVPWKDIVASNPAYVGTDGVHQTSTGRAEFRSAILGGINQCAALILESTTTTSTVPTTSTTIESTTTTVPLETTTTSSP